MSRNLCRTDCRQCDGRVVMDGLLRQETYGEFSIWGVFGCDAVCEDCGTKYFAWVAEKNRQGHAPRLTEDGFYDLSYRSSFNDEPGEGDIPAGGVVVRYERVVEVNGKIVKQAPFERG
jgi:hypothetical protein